MPNPPRTPPADEAAHILVVDDDRRLRELLARFLAEQGYRVTTAAHAAEAEGWMESLVFDALVLDVMMPGENGFDFARRLRSREDGGVRIPILMLTARAGASDRIQGLELGADDYLPKPFEPRELTLRLGNILRRTQAPVGSDNAARPEAVRFGPFSYRFERGELREGETLIRITDREREILTRLAEKLGEPVAREDLAEQGLSINDRTVDVQINRLRRKIEKNPAEPVYLTTVRGIGYRLVIERGMT